MTSKTRQAARGRAARGRAGFWIIGAVVLAAVVGLGYRSWDRNPVATGSDPSILIGRWLRPDGGYVLELREPTPEGLLKAGYSNPQSIHVSHAEWRRAAGELGVFVELRDVNYPGSTYTLAYEPVTDRLVGSYYQALLQQQFTVEFERLR